MKNKVFLPIILGTNRDGRKSKYVADFLVSEIGKRDDIESKLFDVMDFKMPAGDYGGGVKGEFPEWTDSVSRSDGLIIVFPEYNHSYPGSLKSVLDMLYFEYSRKAVGLVGVSSGGWGGVRAIEHLLPVVRELGLVVTHRDLQFSNVGDVFDEDGKIKDESYSERTKKFLDELVSLAKILKWGRENIPQSK